MDVYLKEVQIRLDPEQRGFRLYDYIIKELRKVFAEHQIIRWAITRIDEDILNVVTAVTAFNVQVSYDLPDLSSTRSYAPFAIVQIVPTGVGASIGGYAGDASPTARLLASVSDIVITHPNIVNASDFYGGCENVLYVEGFTLDQFILGHVALIPRRLHHIGIIVDEVSEEELAYVLTAANVVRSVYGIHIIGYSIVKGSIAGTAQKTSAGTYDGYIENPRGLLDAAQKLISKGATAIAIISKIRGVSPEEVIENYRGISPHPIGGVEAIISRLVSSYFSIPVAHAPIFDFRISDKIACEFECNPRAAGEVVSRTGLPCVLLGLSKAPTIIKKRELKDKQAFLESALTVSNVAAIISPSSTMGGVPMLVCEKLGIPIISVEENTTILDVTGDKLGIANEVKVSNYLEATGIVAALKAGIDWNLVRKPINKIVKI